MSDPKFTPGPWKAEPSGAISAGNEDIAIVYTNNGGDDPCLFPYEANASLIAAAPDLYAACKMVASFVQSWQPLSPGDIKVMTDAIAKAEGRTDE